MRTKCTNCRDYFPKGTEWWSNNVQRVCSEECFNEYTESRRQKARDRRPKKSPAPKSQAHRIPPEIRHHVEDRDVHCRICGYPGQEVHHVTFRSQGGKHEVSNLIFLCTECHHGKAHGSEAKQYAQLFRAHIWLAEVVGRPRRWDDLIEGYGWMIDGGLPIAEWEHLERGFTISYG